MSEKEARKTYLRDVELAKVTTIAAQTYRNWRSAHKGPPYIKVGRAVLYDLAEVETYLQKRTVRPEGGGK